MTDSSIYRAFSASEWADLERRAAERDARANGTTPAVRSDSVQGDGLIKKTIVCPETGRKIYEFELADGASKRDGWMRAYRAEPQLQLGLNKDNLDRKTFERRGKQRYAEQQATAKAIAEHGMQGVPSFSIAHSLAEAGDAAYVKFGGGKGS